MKKLRQNRKTQQGFTLLEVIITITIAAILASVLVSFMGTSIIRSSDSINQVRNLGTSNQNMEIIDAAFARYLSQSITWSAFKTTCGNNATVSTVTSDSSLYNPDFETIQVTTTTGLQKMVTYYME